MESVHTHISIVDYCLETSMFHHNLEFNMSRHTHIIQYTLYHDEMYTYLLRDKGL